MPTAIESISVKTNSGGEASLGDHQGKVRLVVNVASKCGLTPQYEGLQALHARFRDRGFTVLAFPANNFAGQEPGTDAEIASFCETNYGIDFPLFAKISVAGEDRHPLYGALVAGQPESATPDEAMRGLLRGHGIEPNPKPEVLWNFEKFLVARDGTVAARFAPDTAPDDPRLIAAIEAELAKAS